jgi:predicted dehydrogenase
VSGFEYLHVVVVGAGSIGRRHIGNLKKLGVTQITAVDPDVERLKPVIEEFGIIPHIELEKALERKPQAVLICTPPSMHVEQCLVALNAGAHVFVEKPLSNSLGRIGELEKEARKAKKIVQVGYNLRFIPALHTLKGILDEGNLGKPMWGRFEVGQYLPDWRPTQDYRQGYSARKELGGGIILDASHEIDLALWLLGKPIELCCMAGRTSDLEMDVEDTATILLRFENGAQADVHLDCVQREYSRGLKIAFERGTASWSWPDNILRIFEVEKGERLIYPPVGYTANQMYVDELQHFLCSVVVGEAEDSLTGGREVVRIALESLRSSEERTWVTLNA